MIAARLLAAGGVLAGLAASSCCVAPLVLVSLGVGGAWVGGLTALAPYQPLFLAGALASLGAGFWLVYGRRRAACALPLGRPPGRGLVAGFLWVKGALWLGAALVGLAIGVDYGLPLVM